MHRSLGYSLLGVCALLTPLFALAHHSVAFYSNDKTELAGKITNVDWRNPHIQFGLQTVGADGKEVAWTGNPMADTAAPKKIDDNSYTNSWKLAETAKHLGISRTTLWRRLKAYGLHRDGRTKWAQT